MYKIGITGGIGAGKSTVARIFEVLEIPVYNADQRAKAIMMDDSGVRKKILNLLGDDSYLQSGELNRKYIADQVFTDSWLLNKLNGIVHPAIEEDYHRWHAQQVAPYTMKEAALLFDAGSYLHLDATIVVTASEEVRLNRVIARDKTTMEAVHVRMKEQWPEERRIQLADFIIENDGGKALGPQVLQIHHAILENA